jgi:hypothetical protein
MVDDMPERRQAAGQEATTREQREQSGNVRWILEEEGHPIWVGIVPEDAVLPLGEIACRILSQEENSNANTAEQR